MKIMKKLKEAVLSVGVAIMAIPGKIFADVNDIITDDVPVEALYGIPPSKIRTTSGIFQLIILPLILIIGIVTYCKKSKKSKKNKIIISIILGAIIFGIIVMGLIKIVNLL